MGKRYKINLGDRTKGGPYNLDKYSRGGYSPKDLGFDECVMLSKKCDVCKKRKEAGLPKEGETVIVDGLEREVKDATPDGIENEGNSSSSDSVAYTDRKITPGWSKTDCGSERKEEGLEHLKIVVGHKLVDLQAIKLCELKPVNPKRVALYMNNP